MAASNTDPFPDVGTFTASLVIFLKAICRISQKIQGRSITAAAFTLL